MTCSGDEFINNVSLFHFYSLGYHIKRTNNQLIEICQWYNLNTERQLKQVLKNGADINFKNTDGKYGA